MIVTPILLSCLLAAQTPLEKLSCRAGEFNGTWTIQYQFNQDLSPDLKIYISGKVASFQYAFHRDKMNSVLSSEKPTFFIAEGKCYEELSYNLLDKRSLSITISHRHDNSVGIPLSGKRFISVKSGNKEFRDVIYLHSGDLH